MQISSLLEAPNRVQTQRVRRAMTPDHDCGNHGDGRRKTVCCISCCSVFIFIAIFISIFVWAILNPTKPRFALQNVTVSAFNFTQQNLLTSKFQIMISSRNPNKITGFYYDQLRVYATYCGQQITFLTDILPTYQDHGEADIWSSCIFGTSVPIESVNALSQEDEQWNGGVALMIRVDGRVSWKVGMVSTGKFHLNVKCPAYINVVNKAAGVPVGKNSVKYTLVTECSVSV